MNSAPKALLLFADLFTTGGIQQYNRHLCNALEKEFPEDEFTALSLYDSEESERARGWCNIRMIYCGSMDWKFARKINFVFKALRLAASEKPGLVVCSHIDLVPVAMLIKKIFNIKYLILTHGTDVWSIKKGIKRRGLEGADMVITVSRYTGGSLVRNGVDSKKIRYLYNTFDPALFRIKPKDEGLTAGLGLADKKIILTVGRIRSEERYKGHTVMLEALAALGEDYAWLVVGDGDLLASLKDEAGRLSLGERAIFAGCVDDKKLPDYYNACDCFAMPSKGEGFGIVFLEALACGKPVIGGDRDGTGEPLMDGKLGFMIDPDSVGELVKAIELACAAKEARTDPEYLAREVRSNFGVAIFDKRVKEIFSEAMGLS